MPLETPGTKWWRVWRGCWPFLWGPLCWADGWMLPKGIRSTIKYEWTIVFSLLIHWLQICKLSWNQGPCNKAREKVILINRNWKCRRPLLSDTHPICNQKFGIGYHNPKMSTKALFPSHCFSKMFMIPTKGQNPSGEFHPQHHTWNIIGILHRHLLNPSFAVRVI